MSCQAITKLKKKNIEEEEEDEEEEVRREEGDHHHHQTSIPQGTQAMAQIDLKSVRTPKPKSF